MTKDGYEKLKQELDHIIKVDRPKNIKDIEEARGHGDLSENAEYHAAKEKQGMLDAKKRELQHKLAHAQIIDVSKLSNEKVVFGATVTLADTDSGDIKKYMLVGQEEADFKKGRYRYSPLLARRSSATRSARWLRSRRRQRPWNMRYRRSRSPLIKLHKATILTHRPAGRGYYRSRAESARSGRSRGPRPVRDAQGNGEHGSAPCPSLRHLFPLFENIH